MGDEEPGVEEGSRSILTASGSLPFSSPAFPKKPSNWGKSPMETSRDWASLNGQVRMEQWRCCGHLLNYTSVFIGILRFLFPFWWKNFAVTLSLKKTGKKKKNNQWHFTTYRPFGQLLTVLSCFWHKNMFDSSRMVRVSYVCLSDPLCFVSVTVWLLVTQADKVSNGCTVPPRIFCVVTRECISLNTAAHRGTGERSAWPQLMSHWPNKCMPLSCTRKFRT